MRDLRPVAGRIHYVVRELTAISVRDSGYQPAAVVTGMKLNFRDARKILADNVFVPLGIGAEFVKINLLVEVGVLRRTLITLRVARVIKPGAIGLPVEAASRGCEVDPRDDIGKFLARGD